MASIKWVEMSVAKQLYQLQEVDLELESTEQALNQITSQLGESEAVVRTRNRLALEQKRREDLERKQRSVEWEIDDLTSKLVAAEEQLYSGKIRNPKELTNLQHETDLLKSRRTQLEEKVLEIMDQVELTTQNVANLNGELKVVEAEWQSRQQQLSVQMEQLKTALANLKPKRQLLAAGVEPQTIEVYHQLKKQKGTAVAKVEQGTCCGCRISLPITELQRARSGSLVRCSSCGRILFLA